MYCLSRCNGYFQVKKLYFPNFKTLSPFHHQTEIFPKHMRFKLFTGISVSVSPPCVTFCYIGYPCVFSQCFKAIRTAKSYRRSFYNFPNLKNNISSTNKEMFSQITQAFIFYLDGFLVLPQEFPVCTWGSQQGHRS